MKKKNEKVLKTRYNLLHYVTHFVT